MCHNCNLYFIMLTKYYFNKAQYVPDIDLVDPCPWAYACQIAAAAPLPSM